MNNVKVLYYDRIDVSEGIDVMVTATALQHPQLNEHSII